jgi:hypothetical protein
MISKAGRREQMTRSNLGISQRAFGLFLMSLDRILIVDRICVHRLPGDRFLEPLTKETNILGFHVITVFWESKVPISA